MVLYFMATSKRLPTSSYRGGTSVPILFTTTFLLRFRSYHVSSPPIEPCVVRFPFGVVFIAFCPKLHQHTFGVLFSQNTLFLRNMFLQNTWPVATSWAQHLTPSVYPVRPQQHCQNDRAQANLHPPGCPVPTAKFCSSSLPVVPRISNGNGLLRLCSPFLCAIDASMVFAFTTGLMDCLMLFTTPPCTPGKHHSNPTCL